MSEIIWIDKNINNKENTDYINQLKEEIELIKIKPIKENKDAINHLKDIKHKKVIIIVSGSLYSEFVNSFKENINDMFLVPKIIVFTSSKKKFIEYNKGYLNNNDNKFYKPVKIFSLFLDIKEFLYLEDITNDKEYISNDEIIRLDNSNSSNEIQLTFEYIDCMEKLMLPMFFKSLINYISDKDIGQYTNSLYNKYCKDKDEIESFLGSIKTMPSIPIQILSKYYARFYTAPSNFYKEMNKDLGLNKIDKYLLYIKILYEGVKLKSLPLASNNLLYRGSKISNNEISTINMHMNRKIEGLPGVIVFSKSFLSFSKEKEIAQRFLKSINENKNISKVLFIVEKDDNLGYNLSTHGDIEEISCFPKEKEVLFFPFSAFEIKEINKNEENIYEIKLLYLGKYLKEIENNESITKNENKIPESKFKNQLILSGLVKKEVIQDINPEKLYNSYKEYERCIEQSEPPKIKEKIDLKEEVKEENVNQDDTNKEVNLSTNNVSKEENMRINTINEEEKFINIYTIKLTERTIKGKIKIGPNDINKDIQIISSFENYRNIKMKKK